MDFVTLANAISQTHRYLLEGDGDSSSMHNIAINSPGTSEEFLGAENLPNGSTPPLLSQAAETELFLLATNFLLCKYFYSFSIHEYSIKNDFAVFLKYC